MSHSLRHRTFVFVAAAAFACAAGTAAFAQLSSVASSPTSTPVVVVVKVPKPWYAPRLVVVGKMRETIPQYEQLPGLAHKAFSIAQRDGQYGGIYLWKDRASAEKWFGPAWFARVEKERGAKAEVRCLEAPVVLDNTPEGAAASSESRSVSTLVTIPIPDGIGRERLIAEFKAAVPTYQKVDGLLRKYFVFTADGKFGGVYLWSDQAAAERWFDAKWHDRVQKTYGTDADIEWFDTPILLPSKLADNEIAVAHP